MTPPSNDKPETTLDLKTIKFLKELARTHDFDEAAKLSGLTSVRAESALKGLLGGGEPLPIAKKVATKKGAPTSCVVHVDGASRGNPGKAGAGAVITDTEGNIVSELTRYLGEATNNVAEYEALILALEEAQGLGCTELKVFADSELMVKQIRGEYKVKNETLKGLYAIAKKMVDSFDKFQIKHVRRENNAAADKLANKAIDSADHS